MQTVTVVDVLAAGALAVWPPLQVGGRKSQAVRINGLKSSFQNELRGEIARCKLTLHVLGCPVKIMRAWGVSEGGVVCDVYYGGRNLVEHFPEYAVVCLPQRDSDGFSAPEAVVVNLSET